MGLLPNIVFALSALVAAITYYATVQWLVSVSDYPASKLTAAQIGISLGYGLLLATWAGAEAAFFVASHQPRYGSVGNEGEDEEGEQLTSQMEKPATSKLVDERVFFVRRSHLKSLRYAAEFVFIMGYVYLCDRTSVFAKGKKEVSGTRFWLLNLAILVAAATTMRSSTDAAVVKPLQRDQTEEWKGWMQIMFVLYHYFAEAEIYNAIRLYIAAYVWMTGFGNFSYYYIKKDFTLVRFMQMMWRLNFFVFFMCVTMNNEYMLYYICPMHTLFTLLVYLCLYIGQSINEHTAKLLGKMAITVAITVVLWDVPGPFHALFGPFRSILGFHDPLHPEFTDDLHEWFFRSGLDHLVWIFGMLCAFSFPWFDAQLQAVEQMPSQTKILYKSAILGVTLLASGVYIVQCFMLPKKEYNKVHPYTSFIPIFCYLVLRNVSVTMRRYHMHLFAWCGKVTLETYILQFHIWMKTTGLNGSPKHLMVWLPGWYWTNLLLITCVYIFLSYRVFFITAALKDVMIPNSNFLIGKRAAVSAAVLALLYGAGVLLKG